MARVRSRKDSAIYRHFNRLNYSSIELELSKINRSYSETSNGFLANYCRESDRGFRAVSGVGAAEICTMASLSRLWAPKGRSGTAGRDCKFSTTDSFDLDFDRF